MLRRSIDAFRFLFVYEDSPKSRFYCHCTRYSITYYQVLCIMYRDTDQSGLGYRIPDARRPSGGLVISQIIRLVDQVFYSGLCSGKRKKVSLSIQRLIE